MAKRGHHICIGYRTREDRNACRWR
ncbi:hypothetical protein [Xenorhabdus cabanillasii]|nr:hypothetical protein [Xenorhabdus cabanillasii]